MTVSANGLLRQYLGMQPNLTMSGAAYWSKAVLQAAAHRSGILDIELRKRLAVTFKLDPEAAGAIIDL